MVRISKSVADTESIAGELAKSFKGGECVALNGEMGAGKTQFVRGIVEALGGNPRAVSSPTFTLLNIYETPAVRVFHLDAYRVAGPSDFDAIGFPELLEQNGVVIVEWADRVRDLLPANAIEVSIHAISKNQRRISTEFA